MIRGPERPLHYSDTGAGPILDAMRWIAGLSLIVLGSALAVYAVPFVSYVALGAFLAGIAMSVSGIVLLTRASRQERG